ncbi:ABC transporter [Streptomyces sp. NPDC007084]|uniref:ABC transporter n=1 Tax=Streptomyces sp. NPDC007084 TaxID=3154313 RepID=UPI003451514B
MRGVGAGGGSGPAEEAGRRAGESRQAGRRPGESRGYAVCVALVRPVWRSLARTALAVGALLGLLLAGTPRMFAGPPDPWLCLNVLRAAALALGLGLAFLLDDPARHTTAVVPAPRPLRTGLRLGLVVPLAAAWWTAALFLIPADGRPPVGAMTLEAAAFAALALASGIVALRHTEATEPGIAVAAGLLGTTFAAALLLPDRWALFVATNDPHWADAHWRWAGVLVVAVLAGACSVTEPLRRRRVAVVGRRSGAGGFRGAGFARR